MFYIVEKLGKAFKHIICYPHQYNNDADLIKMDEIKFVPLHKLNKSKIIIQNINQILKER